MKKITLFLLNSLIPIILAACVMPADTHAQYQVQEYTEEVWLSETPTQTSTAEPSETPQPTATTTSTVTPTETIVYASPTPIELGEMSVSRTDRIKVIQDMNYPDETVLKPVELIMKTWRVQNTGTETWNTEYRMTYVQENNTYNGPVMSKIMFFPADTTLGWNIGSWPEPLQEVAPGEIVDLTVLLQMPNKHGYQFESWHVINDKGEILGTPLWSQLQVNGTIAEDQLGWNGSWLMNDPFGLDPFQPVTLVLETSDGLVVLLGCGHAGLLNILAQVRAQFEGDIITIAGGTHLTSATSDMLQQAVETLESTYGTPCIYPSHCSGHRAMVALASAFGDRVQTIVVDGEINTERVVDVAAGEWHDFGREWGVFEDVG